MNSTERVMAAIHFETPDRLPTWDEYWGDFPETWRRYKNLAANVEPSDYYGMDVSICVANELFFPSQRRMVRESGGYEVWQDGWGRTIKVGKRDVYFMEHLDSALKQRTDLERLIFEPAGLEMRYREFAECVNSERRAGRCVFVKVGGIYIRSHFLYGEDRLLVAMAEDKEFCDALFDKVADHLTSMAIESLKRANAYETGLWVYDDMANRGSTMFSPAMFARFFLPRYQRLIAACQKAGCKHFFLHSDGNIGPVLDLLLDAGFEGFNPLEPRCGLELPKLREKYGKRMIFFGGVCNTRILPGGNKKEIETHVRPLIEMGREGGVVLGTASIGEDVSPETYDYYQSLVRKHGNYSSNGCPHQPISES